MSTLPLSRLPGARSQQPATPIRLATSTSPRSRTAVLVGVLLIAGFGLAFVLTALHVDHRPSVLVIKRPVAAGAIIKADDIGTVRVSSDPALHPIASTSLNQIIGRPAAVGLVPGGLLTDGQIGAGADLQANQTLVGVAVKPGQFPPGLAVGSHVQVIQTASDGSGSVIADGAVVTSVAAPGGSDLTAATVVGLKVDSTASASVAGASGAGQVGLVQEPQS